MTQTPHDTAGPGDHGSQGPRIPPAQMRDVTRLRRSSTDRRIAGVAGGIGRHLDVDPTVIRVLLVVLAFFGGAGLLLYAAVWLFVPEDGSDQAPVATAAETRTVVIVVALVLAALLVLGNSWWLGFGPGWPPPIVPLVLVGLAVWLVVRNRDRGPAPPGGHESGASRSPGPTAPDARQPAPPRPPRERSLLGITLACVLLALGVVAIIEVAGAALPWAAYPAAALAVVGTGLLAGAFVGRTTGLGFVGLVAAAVLAAAVWAPELRFGEVDTRPSSAAEVESRYAYTAGRIQLDLTGVGDLERLDGRVVDLSMRAGEVIVRLPEGLDVDVVAQAQGGRLDVLGRVVEGRLIDNDRSTPDTAAPDLRINLDMGFGHARVSTP